MNKTEQLKQVIRALVKEEVSRQVSKAMGQLTVELLKEVTKPTKSELREAAHETQSDREFTEPPYVEQEETAEEEQPPSRVAVIKTTNPKLAAVLAETARNFRPLQKVNDAVAGLDSEFEKIGGNERMTLKDAGSKVQFLKDLVGESVSPAATSITDNAAVPVELKKVFKKDFRALMRKMDEVKKTGGSGMILPS
jgi:hypothetical protein